jgi:hypothetical protein
MNTAKGWAVRESAGEILVKTVSDTRRAAIVNYLVVEHQFMVTRLHSDHEIENLWRHYGKYADVLEVTISAHSPHVSTPE